MILTYRLKKTKECFENHGEPSNLTVNVLILHGTLTFMFPSSALFSQLASLTCALLGE